MSRAIALRASSPEAVGHDVLGPVVAEFCLRLWTLGQLMTAPDESVMLFCARGGLRLQYAYRRFLDASGFSSATPVASLMVSRLVAARGSIARALTEDRDSLFPATATALGYEFTTRSTRDAARALTGHEVAADPRWDRPFDPSDLLALLRDPQAGNAAESLVRQEALFAEHLHAVLAGRRHAVLVDTGFYGTTRELLAEGHPELDFGSALLARSMRPGYPTAEARTSGLLVEAAQYVPLRPRTSLLRNWHFIEWIFEPALPSVTTFHPDDTGHPRADLEVPAWLERVAPDPGSPFAGVISYLDGLPKAPGAVIAADSARAWAQLHRAIVFPDHAAGEALDVAQRTQDFGREGTWAAREWRGPVASLRGTTIWREGEIARSGTRLRAPLLAGIEAGHGARYLLRRVRAARDRT